MQIKPEPPLPHLGNVAKGTFYNFAGALSRNVFGFLTAFILAKVLSVDDMGLFFLAFSVTMLATITVIGGMDAGLRRFISIAHGDCDTSAPWEFFYTATVVVVVACLIMGFLLYFTSGLLANLAFDKPEAENAIKAFIPFIFFYSLAELLLSATQGYKQMKYWVICLDFINSILRIVFIVSLPLLGFGLFGAILGYDLAIFIAAAIALYYFVKVMPTRSTKHRKFRFREIISFSFPVALARLVNSGNGMVETILLGLFLAQADIGIFNVALKISAVGAIVLASFNTMFSPIISEMHHQNKLLELRQLFSCVTRWAFSLGLPLFMLIAWYAESMASFFGPEYVSGATCIVILCLGQIVNALTGPSGNVLLMSGYKYINLWTNFAGLVLSIILNLLLIPKYGIVGCAWAIGLTITAVNIVRVLLAWKIMNMHPYDTNYWKPFTSAALILAAVYFLGPDRQDIISAYALLFVFLSATAGYFLILASFGLNVSDKYILQKIKVRLGIHSLV